jgi:hypothetical protein
MSIRSGGPASPAAGRVLRLAGAAPDDADVARADLALRKRTAVAIPKPDGVRESRNPAAAGIAPFFARCDQLYYRVVRDGQTRLVVRVPIREDSEQRRLPSGFAWFDCGPAVASPGAR